MSAFSLSETIEKGMQPGNDLLQTLREQRDVVVRSLADARAICQALAKFPSTENPDMSQQESASSLHALIGLFQEVESTECPAFAMLIGTGTEHLVRIVRQTLDSDRSGDGYNVLFALKILAMYGTPLGTTAVIETARSAFRADDFMWSVILSHYTCEHPEHHRLIESLRDPLPAGFIGIAYLDAVNLALIDGSRFRHPFNSADGKRRLQAWLTTDDPNHFSTAHSATAALPFIEPPERDQLIALAMDHPDAHVQMEAAWASAKLGSESGLRCLARYCLDRNLSAIACRYLVELRREDAIPDVALEPEFRAVAEVCEWLAHPNEFGLPPNEVEAIASRELYWPPTDDRRRLWIVKYRYEHDDNSAGDECGIAVVGSVTFSLFGETSFDHSPNDIYALHCCWELEIHGDPRTPTERTVAAGRAILARYNKQFR